MTDYKKLPIGSKAPHVVNAVIEIPKGSSNKYEFDPDLGVFKLDRVLYSPVFYPADYGFIPGTHAEDGDPLDILVLVSHPTFPGCVIDARPVGVLEMTDEKGLDEKVLAVAENDPRYKMIQSLDQVNSFLLKEIANFFETYKILEGKKTELAGWAGAEVAHQKIKKYTVK